MYRWTVSNLSVLVFFFVNFRNITKFIFQFSLLSNLKIENSLNGHY